MHIYIYIDIRVCAFENKIKEEFVVRVLLGGSGGGLFLFDFNVEIEILNV